MEAEMIAGKETHHPEERQHDLVPADSTALLQKDVERLREGNAKLLRQLAAARDWYDEENPAELGHDQVYPWDHA